MSKDPIKKLVTKNNSRFSLSGKPAKTMQKDKSNRWLNERLYHFTRRQTNMDIINYTFKTINYPRQKYGKKSVTTKVSGNATCISN